MHLGMNAISLRRIKAACDCQAGCKRGGMATLLWRLELSSAGLNDIFWKYMKEWICCILILGYTGYSRQLNFKQNWTNLPKLWLAMGWKLESPDEWLNLHFRPWTVKLPPHILGHSPLHSMDQVLDEKAVDVSQGMVELVRELGGMVADKHCLSSRLTWSCPTTSSTR